MASNGEGTEKLIHSYGSTQSEKEPPPLYSRGLEDRDKRAATESSLAFIGVSYFVPEGWNCFPRRGNEKKVKKILNSTSGLMLPGLNAIMGPTGSGKTSLLDILADRKSSSRVSGTVLVNGERRMKDFRFLSGYVVQDDIVNGNMSVRENLHFSAALRLPSHMTFKQRKERVERVIEELGLRNCADQRIGTEFIRGVSGGERKRTNIGMELIIEPQVLFLDEPTTGLDAHTAISVVKLLKDLSSNGDRIVIMSIHQPRYSIFKLFDTVTLLSLGNMVYHGPARQVLNYFSSIGFECEEHDNPADFFLDVIMKCERELQQRNALTNEKTPLVSSTVSSQTELTLVVDLGEKFSQSAEHHAVELSLQPMVARLDDGNSNGGVWYKNGNSLFDTYATTAFWQFLVVSHRSVLNMWRNPMTNILQTFVMVVFALMVGGIYFQRDDTPRGMQDKLGVIFFLILSQVFGNLGAIEVFIKDRVAFLHETSSGYYRVSVFFIAKVLTDLIALRTLPLSVFCVITYFMIGFQVSVEKFFIYYLTIALTTVAGAALAFTFSAMVSVFAVANLLVSLVFILYMLFGGFLIGLDSIPSWIEWLKYLSIFRFAIEALTINEIEDRVYNKTLAVNETCTYRQVDDYCFVYGNDILEFQGYKKNWLWYDEVALALTCAGWLFLTYIILRIVKVYYRHYR